MVICSELDTQKGREDEEGEKEDEEVELAEEVGEDALIMAGAGEVQAEGENGEQNETEGIIEVPLLPNRVVSEENADERLKETGKGGVKMGNKEDEMTDEQTKEEEGEDKGEEESNETNTVIKNQFSAMIEVEGQEQLLDISEEIKDERVDKENKQGEIESLEIEFSEDKSNDRDNGLEEPQAESRTDDAELDLDSGTLVQESAEGSLLSIDENDKADIVANDGEETEIVEHPTIVVSPVTMETQEQFNIQDHLCQTTVDGDNGAPLDTTGSMEMTASQSNQLINEDKYEIENSEEDEVAKQEAKSVNSNSAWQQKDYIEAKFEDEGGKELLENSMSASDDVQEIESEANQKVDESESVILHSEKQSQTEVGTEETTMAGTSQKLEEEHVGHVWDNTLIMMDEVEKNTEEEGMTIDHIVREPLCEEEHGDRGDLEIQEEKIVQFENEAQVDLVEPGLKGVDVVDTEQHVDQVEEADKLEEEATAEPKKPEVDDTSGENETTTMQGGDLQEHPLPIFNLNDTETDWKENLREQLREQDFAEDRKGGAEEEASTAEMEMVEEPVTVLDDEIEETEESPCIELVEQKPAPIADIVGTKVEEPQELQREMLEIGKENDNIQNDRKGEGEKDEKPKHQNDEIELDVHERVKGLRQVMENGILSAEPQPLRKEEWKAARVLSSRRKDDDWIKRDAGEEERAPEVKDWRRELKPVKKDIKETERGQKEPLPDEKSLLKKDDWIKELKSVIKDESLPKKRDEQVKKKRVVLLEDGHSYFPQREEMNETKEVKPISHKKVESPLSPVLKESREPQDQDYEISLYVKVKNR